jgi:hypothetical protein
VRRYFVLLATLMVLFLAAAPRLRALTDEEKKEEFLQARGDDDQSSPSPSPHHKKHAEAEETPHHTHLRTDEQPGETPTPARKAEPPSPSVTPAPEERPARTPVPQPYESSVPQSTPAPTPPPGPSGAQVDIQKEGLEQQLEYEPPPPSTHHHWWQIFSGAEPVQYHYLTREIRDAIDRAPVRKYRWRFIVVHNSGTRQGNARIFDYYHRYVRKMPNGLAYHFVIGNGTSSGNGQIEIGNRWTRQLQGGHVHSDFLNNISLGICLVGDFNRDLPTKEQLEALDELIRYLRIRVGKIDGKPAIVKAHREINPPQWPTDCPGDRFPYHWLHSRFD